MEKEKIQNCRDLIIKLIKEHRKYIGLEEILDKIVDDVYDHAKVVLDNVANDDVIESYLKKVISTSLITVPKKLDFVVSNRCTTIKIDLNQVRNEDEFDDKLVDVVKTSSDNKKKVKEEVTEVIAEKEEMHTSEIDELFEKPIEDIRNLNNVVNEVSEPLDEVVLEPEEEVVIEEEQQEDLGEVLVEEVDLEEEVIEENCIVDEYANYTVIHERIELDEKDVDMALVDKMINGVASKNENDIYEDKDFEDFIESEIAIENEDEDEDCSSSAILSEDVLEENVEKEILPIENENELDIEENEEKILEEIDEVQESIEEVSLENVDDLVESEDETLILDEDIEDLSVQAEENEIEPIEDTENVLVSNDEILEDEDDVINLEIAEEIDCVEDLVPEVANENSLLELGEEEIDETFVIEQKDDSVQDGSGEFVIENSFDDTFTLTSAEDNDETLFLDGESEMELVEEVSLDLTQDEVVLNEVTIDANVDEDIDNSVDIFGCFAFKPEEIETESDYEYSEIEQELFDIDKKHPEYKVFEVYDLKFNKNMSVEDISKELDLPVSNLIDVLNEITYIVKD